MTLLSLSNRTKWIIAIVVSVAYSLCVIWLMGKYGPSITILSVIPVSFLGFLLGSLGGFVASIFAILINIFLVMIMNRNGISGIFEGGFLAGGFIVLLAGVLTGKVKQSLDHRLKNEAEFRSRERYLSMLNKMTHSIIASDDFDSMMDMLIQDLKNLFNADDCYLTRWNDETKKTTPLKTSANLDKKYYEMDIPVTEISLTRSVIEKGDILIAEDVFNSPYISPAISSQFPAKSMMGVPLIYGQSKLGALLIAYNTPHVFSPEEKERAKQAGDQIAIAFWNAQQEAELQRRLRESKTLARISQALSETERIGLQTVLQLIVASAKELIPGVEQAVIHLLDDKQEFLIPEAVIGYNNPSSGKLNMRVGEGAAGRAVESGQTISINNIESDPRFLSLGSQPKFNSLIVTPVQSGGRKLGTISIQSNKPNSFSQAEGELLAALGTQAAIAIENAHLLESTQRALKEMNSLNIISRGLVFSSTADELVKDVADLLQKNFYYYHVQIFELSPGSGQLTFREGSSEIGAELKAIKYTLAPGAGIVGHVAETGNPFVTNNVDEVLFFQRNPLLPHTQSELAVPIKIDEEVRAVLDIQQIPPKRLTERDLQLMTVVADQLAVALQKANLYSNLQTSLQLEKKIRNQMVQNERLALMGRLLASVSHELNNPLQAIQNALFLLKSEENISIQGQQDLNIVLSETERMATMIDRLRTTYRPIQAEDFRPTQINNIVEDVYALISTHLRHHQIAFEFYPDPYIPIIPGFTDQIRQVVLNLFINAVEAMKDGGILSVTTHYLEENDEIFLSVTDNGIGIDETILPNIFDAFITNKERGTGLGLTISYDIILKHNGRITAENNPEQGATFKVWLPIKRTDIS